MFRTDRWGRALLLAVLAMPSLAGAQTVLDGYFVEAGGLVVIEAESIGTFPDSWRNVATHSAPNLNDGGSASGGDFLTWEGGQFFNSPGTSELVIPIQINTPGTYRFRWRSQTGQGTNTTEHNDTWVRIDGDAFFGQKGNNGSIVCPKGYNQAENDCTGGVPNGGGGGGWFKVYTSGANSWRWTANTSDNDAHQIYVRFDQAGRYDLRLSARSSFHIIDRMVLSVDGYAGNPESLALPESEFVFGGGTPPPPPPPSGAENPLTVDGSGQWFIRQNTGEPVFMAGVGGPEGFLFETDARKQQIVDQLIARGANALYFHSIRSFEGDGYAFEDPYVVHEDVTSAVDTTVLDNWLGYLDQLDANGIISWFHILDDTARPWGCSANLSNDAKRYIETIVTRFRDLDNLVWLAGEEYRMGSCSNAEDAALMRAIAAEIRKHDPVHPIGVHHNNGQAFAFNTPQDTVINVFAQQICGSSSVRNPDGIHGAAERGDWVYVMAECHPWHLQLIGDNDRRMLRLSNWATAMAGGYVLMYNAYECQERGRLCSLDSNENPVAPNDPHDPSNGMLSDLRRLREFMEASRFSELQPADARATSGTNWVLANDSEGIWIAYSNNTPAAMGVSNLGDINVHLRWYNPANGAEVIQNRNAGDSPFAVPGSLGEDVALFIERTGSVPPPTPQPPVAVNDSYTMTAGTTLSVTAPNGVLANDSDPNGDSLTAVLASGPGNGSFVLASNGSFNYTPPPAFEGMATFRYRASDGALESSAATVSIQVSGSQIALSLVDAGNDQLVQPLVDGLQLVIPQLSLTSWSVAATQTPPGTASVTFALGGPVSQNQTENVAPYALFGDQGGDYAGRDLAPGAYTLTVRAHSGADGAGTVLETLTVRFVMAADEISDVDMLFEDDFESP